MHHAKVKSTSYKAKLNLSAQGDRPSEQDRQMRRYVVRGIYLHARACSDLSVPLFSNLLYQPRMLILPSRDLEKCSLNWPSLLQLKQKRNIRTVLPLRPLWLCTVVIWVCVVEMNDHLHPPYYVYKPHYLTYRNIRYTYRSIQPLQLFIKNLATLQTPAGLLEVLWTAFMSSAQARSYRLASARQIIYWIPHLRLCLRTVTRSSIGMRSLLYSCAGYFNFRLLYRSILKLSGYIYHVDLSICLSAESGRIMSRLPYSPPVPSACISRSPPPILYWYNTVIGHACKASIRPDTTRSAITR